MFDIDLHTHSRFFHWSEGRPTAFDRLGLRLNVAVARARGLDAIAVTNHDYYTSFDIDTGGLELIPGIEISTDEGHVLAVGPNPPERTSPGEMTPEEAVAMARRHDCAVVMAHPFRAGTVKDADIAVDAVEVNGKHPRTAPMVEILADDRALPLVGGSDAHYPIEVGRVITSIDAEELTPESVVDAIRAGRTEYQSITRFPDRYTRKLYAAVHRLKHSVTEPPS